MLMKSPPGRQFVEVLNEIQNKNANTSFSFKDVLSCKTFGAAWEKNLSQEQLAKEL